MEVSIIPNFIIKRYKALILCLVNQEIKTQFLALIIIKVKKSKTATWICMPWISYGCVYHVPFRNENYIFGPSTIAKDYVWSPTPAQDVLVL